MIITSAKFLYSGNSPKIRKPTQVKMKSWMTQITKKMLSSFNIFSIILIRGPKVFVNFNIRIIRSQNILAMQPIRKSKWAVLFSRAIIISYINISSGVSATSGLADSCLQKLKWM